MEQNIVGIWKSCFSGYTQAVYQDTRLRTTGYIQGTLVSALHHLSQEKAHDSAFIGLERGHPVMSHFSQCMSGPSWTMIAMHAGVPST